MKFRATHTITLATGLLGLAGCGSEELFQFQAIRGQLSIETEAIARILPTPQPGQLPFPVGELSVVGDIDGDGNADAVFRSSRATGEPNPNTSIFGHAVWHVLYGGTLGERELSALPSLTSTRFPPGESDTQISPAGDVDGDGLADFLLTYGTRRACDERVFPISDAEKQSGAYLVYGRTARFTGATSLAQAGVYLHDPAPCTGTGDVASGLGDLDGDGKDDIAIGGLSYVQAGETGQIYVVYGRAERLTGSVDLATVSAAVMSVRSTWFEDIASLIRAGDVDGDGHGDFFVHRASSPSHEVEFALIPGSATRLTGAFPLDELPRKPVEGDDLCHDTAPTALGDLDGDGADDFAIISCERGRFWGGVSATRTPSVGHLFYGRSGGFPSALRDADATFTSSGKYRPTFGAGDVDGDGNVDLIVGNASFQDDRGAVHVIPGNGRFAGSMNNAVDASYVGDIAPEVVLPDFPAGRAVGRYLGVGDVTGDGRADILAGAPTIWGANALGGPGARAYLVSASARSNP